MPILMFLLLDSNKEALWSLILMATMWNWNFGWHRFVSNGKPDWKCLWASSYIFVHLKWSKWKLIAIVTTHVHGTEDTSEVETHSLVQKNDRYYSCQCCVQSSHYWKPNVKSSAHSTVSNNNTLWTELKSDELTVSFLSFLFCSLAYFMSALMYFFWLQLVLCSFRPLAHT